MIEAIRCVHTMSCTRKHTHTHTIIMPVHMHVHLINHKYVFMQLDMYRLREVSCGLRVQ